MMSWWKKQAKAIARTLLCFVLFTLLLGCGGTSGVASPTPTATVPSSPAIEGFDIAGLHIQAGHAGCIFDGTFGAHLTGGNLILKDTHPNNYQSSEVQQMEEYAQKIYDRKLKPTDPMPATLNAVQGGSICGSSLEITNISWTTVQLQSINMRLITAPKSNATRYTLVDICSILPASEKFGCPGSLGGGNPLLYAFQFKMSPTGHVFQPQPQSSSGSIALKPNDVVDIVLDLASAGTPDNFIYSVVPQLVLNTGTIELKPAAMEFIFADQNQFTCVQLSKNTFAPESPIPPAVWVPGGGHWCV